MSQKTKAMRKSVEVVESDEPMMLLVHENRYDFSKDSDNWNQPMIPIPNIEPVVVKGKKPKPLEFGKHIMKGYEWTQDTKRFNFWLEREHYLDRDDWEKAKKQRENQELNLSKKAAKSVENEETKALKAQLAEAKAIANKLRDELKAIETMKYAKMKEIAKMREARA